MRTLVVGATLPWPEITGARIRLANIVLALRPLGEIDLFALADPGQSDSDPSPALGGVRLEIARRPRADGSLLSRVQGIARGRIPRALDGRDYARVRAHLATWAHPPYDLVWLNRAETYAAIWTPALGPTIVDLDDLEDRKIAHRAATYRFRDTVAKSVLHAARNQAAYMQGKRDARLWHSMHGGIADTVQAVVVCSEVDRRHLGVPNAVVIPNGYDYQARPVGRTAIGHPPTISFCGFLAYPPNVDAARYLVKVIAPLIWTHRPDVQIRLVGRAAESVQQLHAPPRVIVTGLAPTIETELARADLVAVPLRVGGGTRIKILEAFAHRIPIVSTTVGAEGLEITPGRELLIADAPEKFASSCLRLLTDTALRASLTNAAHRVFLQHYRWDHIHPMIASLAAQIAVRGPQWSRA